MYQIYIYVFVIVYDQCYQVKEVSIFKLLIHSAEKTKRPFQIENGTTIPLKLKTTTFLNNKIKDLRDTFFQGAILPPNYPQREVPGAIF